MDLRTFGERVARLRRVRGLTQEELADAVEVTRQQVQNWERGRKGTTTKRLLQVYDALGVTAEQFWDSSYIPGTLFNQNGKTPTTSVIGAGVPDVDENGRALVCPRCKRGGYSEHAIYCPNCAFPLYNLCSHEDRHLNIASARYCETCGSKTFWGMDADELKANGVPPMRSR